MTNNDWERSIRKKIISPNCAHGDSSERGWEWDGVFLVNVALLWALIYYSVRERPTNSVLCQYNARFRNLAWTQMIEREETKTGLEETIMEKSKGKVDDLLMIFENKKMT